MENKGFETTRGVKPTGPSQVVAKRVQVLRTAARRSAHAHHDASGKLIWSIDFDVTLDRQHGTDFIDVGGEDSVIVLDANEENPKSGNYALVDGPD